ncbi:MAG: enoyl-CoA hydratase/isomerase family protein [Microthrixaceae bacterium]
MCDYSAMSDASESATAESSHPLPPPAVTTLSLAIEGAVGHIELNRPEKLNALSRSALDDLATAARWFDTAKNVKVVVIRGAGRAFCSGFDLQDRTWAELGQPERSAATGRAMAEAIVDMKAITVAAIHGHCIGGGVVLAAACDLRIATVTAQFRIPEIDLGMPLFWTGIPLLVREIGPARTKELVLTGRAVSAADADRIGLVNQVVPDDQLETTVLGLAAQLAAKPAHVVSTTKRQVDAVVAPVPHDDPGVDSDVAGLAAAFRDSECRESATAYLERLMTRKS